MTQKFYSIQEVISGNIFTKGHTHLGANGDKYRIVVILPNNKAVVQMVGSTSMVIVDVANFFIKPPTLKELVTDWWSNKFGKKLSSETFNELKELFATEGLSEEQY